MLTLIRHAKTEFNYKRLFQGQLDINLSESGINETIEKNKNFSSKYFIKFWKLNIDSSIILNISRVFSSFSFLLNSLIISTKIFRWVFIK